ncbi:MAG: transcriptional repressor [Desulfobacterales bacterium]|nr:transcriptional repressor [Desulfobacterales bacterium]
MTRQRTVILEELKKVKTHPGADEIYAMVRKRLPRISLGTVYRNLEVLSELREIQKIGYVGTLKRFDGTPENHYHIRCIKCDRLDDALIEIETNLENKVRPYTNYSIIGHRLEFIGFCPECAKSPQEDAYQTEL